MSTATRTEQPQRLVIFNVDWKGYLRFLRCFENRPAWRLTYDRGTLEIMNVTYEHESNSYIFGRFVDTLTEELDLDVAGGRSTTFKRQKKKRGLEADNCYWIANEAKVRGKLRIDVRVDPPPDLALEVDITSSSLNRMAIYASIEVPELWRYDGQTLGFHELQKKKYVSISTSRCFPGLTPADLLRFLALRGQLPENGIIRQFRAWVRQQIAAGILSK